MTSVKRSCVAAQCVFVESHSRKTQSAPLGWVQLSQRAQKQSASHMVPSLSALCKACVRQHRQLLGALHAAPLIASGASIIDSMGYTNGKPAAPEPAAEPC